MFHVYKSNRSERLVDALAALLAKPPASPLAPEWIGIQTQGVGTWLAMALSKRLGVFANIHLPFPRALIEEIFQVVLGPEAPDTAAFQRERLTWSIMAQLPELLGHPEFETLRRYLADDADGLKRFQLAQRIAHLFDQYVVYRPDMIAAWEKRPSAAEALAVDQRWQPLLWRALVARWGATHMATTAQLCLKTLQAKRFDQNALPGRIALFGISTLPPLFVHILAALSEIVPVHLFCLSPTREYWAHVRSQREMDRLDEGKMFADSHDPDIDLDPAALYFEQGNPLLAAMGRLGRDFQYILETAADYVEPESDLYLDPAPARDATLLEQIQSDILHLKRRGSRNTPSVAVAPGDHSIRVHACHSPRREVQVLLDQLLEIFETDPQIQPHDVIVMAPDIDLYAPFVETVFTGDPHTSIPYAISDRGTRYEAVVVQAFLTLPALAQGRLPLQDVIDLLALDPVRERFGLAPQEVLMAQHWLREAGVRWGADAGQRAAAGQPELNQNTWRFGLERLLLGYALGTQGQDLFCDTAGYDKIEGQVSGVLGRVVDFCRKLFDALRQLTEPRPLAAWVATLARLQQRLLAETTHNTHQHQMIRNALQTLASEGAAGGFEGPLSLGVIQSLLDQRLAQQPSGQGFLGGGITFCNFLPMRSIPFKVVCLLGMNDGAFPRTQPEPGFDLMRHPRRMGDRSMRDDDRYLFLEALLSARSRLIITHVGHNVRQNTPQPPSVVVSELMDVVADGFYKTGDSLKSPPPDLQVDHPLQPFSPRYFDGATARLFSYSSSFLAAAKTLCARPDDPDSQDSGAFLPAPLPPDDELSTAVELGALVRFFQNPAKAFLQQRLAVVFDDDEDLPESREPLEITGLERYLLGESLLGAMVSGATQQALYPLVRASGQLPLGTPGRCAYQDLTNEITPLAEEARRLRGSDPLPPLAVDLEIGDTRITGSIADIWPPGRIVVTCARLTPQRRLALWITHLVLNCSLPHRPHPPSTLIVRDNPTPATLHLKPLGGQARPLLADLVSLYRQGLNQPLLFFPRASEAFARTWLAGGENHEQKAFEAALKPWRPTDWDTRPAESVEAHIARLFGDHDPLSPDHPKERATFGRLALRVFEPLFKSETEFESEIGFESANPGAAESAWEKTHAP